MAKHAESLFKFCCGGLYDGYRELEIFKSGDGRHATYSKSFCPKPECRDFHVTDAQMEKLERQLDISGVEDWTAITTARFWTARNERSAL